MRLKYLIPFHVLLTISTALAQWMPPQPQIQLVTLNSGPRGPFIGFPGSDNKENGIKEETLEINRGNDLENKMPKVLGLYLLFGPLRFNSETLKALQIEMQRQEEQLKFSQGPKRNSSNSVDCYTRKGQEGYCTTFKECFPVEYYSEDNEVKPDHTALVDEMFTTSKSPGCVSTLNSVGDVEKIICCPMSKPSSLTEPAKVVPDPVASNSTNVTSTMLENVTGEFAMLNSTVVPEIEENTPEISTIPSSINVGSTAETEMLLSSTVNSGDAYEETTGTATTSITTERITTELNSKVESPLPNHCGKVKVYSAIKSSKITGGKEARRGEFPWMVAIFGKNGKQFCGGTLLNSQYVLTASHCLSTYNAFDVGHLYVTIGDHNIHSTREGHHETRKISQLILHRGFEIKTYNNDVALLKLERAVDFTEYIQPICLPEANSSQSMDGYEVVVAGWGRERSYGSSVATLRKVNIPIWKHSECQRVFNTFAPGRLTEKNICAGDGKRNKDACIGDSGGPLMQNVAGVWHQVGIVSWGKGCGSFPGVYTRVDQFLSWIEKNIR